ncbi:hypothetical protein NPIL_478221 [Nephila pilipes]|uniref:Uncharacterized protein n=1 Tax=Nephila pilipes TaxID=299642 RepID=A0A8X6UGW1_NEPPI|nr:hypothetical protein NPIL_478221 [Nephila pilipes]
MPASYQVHVGTRMVKVIFLRGQKENGLKIAAKFGWMSFWIELEFPCMDAGLRVFHLLTKKRYHISEHLSIIFKSQNLMRMKWVSGY